MNKSMDSLFSVLFAIIIIVVVLMFLTIFSGKKSSNSKTKKQKGRQAIIHDANKKLASDPHNPSGLIPLSDLYYREHNWEKALPLYETMVNVAAARKEINLPEASLRQGICAIKQNKIQDALKGLLQSRVLQPDTFEVNFYLGQAYLLNKEYEKAIPLFKKAITINHEVAETYTFLGTALYNAKKFRESLPYLKRSLDVNPENKEILYYMADAFSETGNSDKALKIFMHLRPDPEYGAKSSLLAGMIHANQNSPSTAIEDFEIGLRHENIAPEVKIDIQYRMAQCYLKKGDISKSLTLLKEIQSINPTYKDVPTLVTRYQELNQNSNLRLFLIGSNSDFVVMCRKIVLSYFKNARIKIVNIEVTSQYTEVLAEADTDKWEDIVLFRFYRTTGSIGELYIRDFHARMRDSKVGHGYCFTAGTYTDEGKKFTEGRPIELIDKVALTKVLKELETITASQIH